MGAARKAIAEGFAREGAKVIGAEIDQASGEAVALAIRVTSGEARLVHCDVSSGASLGQLTIKTIGTSGRHDCACNNAAIEREALLLVNVTDHDFERTVTVNFYGVFSSMRRQIKAMSTQEGGGSIVNIVSINATRPQPTGAVCNGTKAAVVAVTKAAVSYASQGARINMVVPSAIDTPMLHENMAIAGLKPDRVAP